MIRLRTSCAALACAFAAAAAQADSFDGQIAYHNDVIYHSIILEQTSDLTAWTDSYLDGQNFDPIVSVWHDGHLLGYNDDNPTIAPNQTRYDSGLRLYNLMPGTYLFTIGAYRNFANSNLIGDGFMYDGQAPIALADWCEPASHCNMGPYVTLNWQLTPAVPEPSTWAMLLGGLGLAAGLRRRTR